MSNGIENECETKYIMWWGMVLLAWMKPEVATSCDMNLHFDCIICMNFFACLLCFANALGLFLSLNDSPGSWGKQSAKIRVLRCELGIHLLLNVLKILYATLVVFKVCWGWDYVAMCIVSVIANAWIPVEGLGFFCRFALYNCRTISEWWGCLIQKTMLRLLNLLWWCSLIEISNLYLILRSFSVSAVVETEMLWIVKDCSDEVISLQDSDFLSHARS
jgi:hypothetical protein